MQKLSLLQMTDYCAMGGNCVLLFFSLSFFLSLSISCFLLLSPFIGCTLSISMQHTPSMSLLSIPYPWYYYYYLTLYLCHQYIICFLRLKKGLWILISLYFLSFCQVVDFLVGKERTQIFFYGNKHNSNFYLGSRR